jgi:hypothetical protein
MMYSDFTVSSGRIVSEYCVGKDVKGSYRESILRTTAVFFWMGQGQRRKTSG